MDNLRNTSSKDTRSVTNESNSGECESFWLAAGPPFDQKDYMVSPSDSASVISSEKSPTTKAETKSKSKQKLKPKDLKVDENYVIDSRSALKKIVELVRDECCHHFPDRIKNLIYKIIEGNRFGYVSFKIICID